MAPDRFDKMVLAVLLLAAIVVLLLGPRACRQSAPPLVQAGDIVYDGAFAVPTSGPDFGVTDLAEGGHGLALLADGTLAFGCHSQTAYARVSIVAAGQTAARVVDCTWLPDVLGSGGDHIGGMYQYGDRLVATRYRFYDAEYSADASHQLSDAGAPWTNLFRIGDFNPGFYGGYLGTVPQAWRAALGATAFTGQGILSIIGRTSSGPSAFGFEPGDLGVRDPVTVVPWLYYTVEHPLADPNTQNTLYTRADRLGGAFFVPGTRSVLFVGQHGMGVPCYGMGTATQPPPPGYCYNPLDGAQGEHAYPYRSQVWAYNVEDFVKVREGALPAWQVQPYAVWELPGMSSESFRIRRGGVAFDAASGALYVTQDFGTAPAVHRFHVTTPGPTPPPDAVTYRCTMEITGQTPELLVGPARCEPVAR